MNEKLWARVVHEGDCWIWIGPTAGAGYGTIYQDRRRQYVHRISYEQYVGSIPDGLEIDHLCRNKRCVRPAHLEAVTHAENRRRARQMYCKRGHPLSDGRVVPGHGRACRKCDAMRHATYRARKAAAT